MDTVTLENWWTFLDGDEYTAPECRETRICGLRPDGKRIYTSPVRKVDGRNIVTRSGTHYRLGQANSDFLMEVAAKNYAFDPENPIKIVEERTDWD